MNKDWFLPDEIRLEHICRQCFEEHWKWGDCPNDANWYSPSAIFYCSNQMMWGILYLDILEEGDWPPEHKETGYIGSESRNTGTKFLPAVLFSAEINKRLKTTREAGEALVGEVQDREIVKADGTIVMYVGIRDYDGLSPPAKRVLNYISGWRRKAQTYSQWKRGYEKHHI